MFTIHDSERYERKNRMEEITKACKDASDIFNKCSEHGEEKPCDKCLGLTFETASKADEAYNAYQKLTEIFHETPKSPLASICRYLVTVHPVADILVALSDAFQNESNDILRSIYEENSQPTMGEAIDFSIVAQKILRVQREMEVRK